MKIPVLAVLAVCGLFTFTSCETPPPPDRGAVIEGKVYELKEVDTAPELTGKRTLAVYPRSLQRSGVSGEATIQFVVSKDDGRVGEPEVVQATHPAFGESAVNAVRRWRYVPAVKNGEKVNCRMQVPISFNLSE